MALQFQRVLILLYMIGNGMFNTILIKCIRAIPKLRLRNLCVVQVYLFQAALSFIYVSLFLTS